MHSTWYLLAFNILVTRLPNIYYIKTRIASNFNVRCCFFPWVLPPVWNYVLRAQMRDSCPPFRLMSSFDLRQETRYEKYENIKYLPDPRRCRSYVRKYDILVLPEKASSVSTPKDTLVICNTYRCQLLSLVYSHILKQNSCFRLIQFYQIRCPPCYAILQAV